VNTRVLVIAEDALARVGLATVLSSQSGCVVVGQIVGNTDWSDAVELYRPDVAVYDLGSAPARALERINLRDGGFPVIALLPDATDAAEVWSAGARSLLLRDISAENLGAAIAAVAHGLVVLDPTLAVAAPRSHEPLSAQPIEELTPRELQVLRLLAEGKSNKEIARKLGISEHTIKFHVNAILGKLNAQSRTEAVVTATRLGLILL
jgi:two-component system, NarL family, nitrate/nitrite response regulator NarL